MKKVEKIAGDLKSNDKIHDYKNLIPILDCYMNGDFNNFTPLHI